MSYPPPNPPIFGSFLRGFESDLMHILEKAHRVCHFRSCNSGAKPFQLRGLSRGWLDATRRGFSCIEACVGLSCAIINHLCLLYCGFVISCTDLFLYIDFVIVSVLDA